MIAVINTGLREIGKIGNATFADAREFIQLADKDKDEKLSKKEMEELFSKIINRYSKNQWISFFLLIIIFKKIAFDAKVCRIDTVNP